MNLDHLTAEQCQTVRVWRNQCLETLRTPHALTEEDQDRFYWQVVHNRDSPHRHWAIMHPWSPTNPLMGLRFLGMGGLTYICWENRIAEISLILDPDARDEGYGRQAVDLLLAEAFDRMGLKTVFGECYLSNGGGHVFWARVLDQWHTYTTMLPNRKFWKGQFWNSMYFSIDADDWRKGGRAEKTPPASHQAQVEAAGNEMAAHRGPYVRKKHTIVLPDCPHKSQPDAGCIDCSYGMNCGNMCWELPHGTA